MGPVKAKLREIETTRESVRENATTLESLRTLKVTTLPERRYGEVIDTLWTVITRLRVSIAQARIVANAKLLHHVLPELVPPIDRQYTYRFFYSRTGLSISEDRAFREMFLRLLRIGTANRDTIHAAPRHGWNTSVAKVIDNAIVGYILSKR